MMHAWNMRVFTYKPNYVYLDICTRVSVRLHMYIHMCVFSRVCSYIIVYLLT